MVRLPLSASELQRGQRLGALLRQARAERSMLDVALTAGISPETLRKIETGRVATPSFATIAAVTDVLGLSLDQVWAAITEAVEISAETVRTEAVSKPAARPAAHSGSSRAMSNRSATPGSRLAS